MSNENENPQVTENPKPRKEFEVHLLNEQGIAKARKLATVLTRALNEVEAISGADGREMNIVRTKFEELSFFAKKAMAQRAQNQKPAQ